MRFGPEFSQTNENDWKLSFFSKRAEFALGAAFPQILSFATAPLL
jgi:hypothetical protein